MFLGTDGAEEDLEIILRMFSSFLLFVYRFIVKYLYVYSFIFLNSPIILRNILNSDTSTKFDQHYQETNIINDRKEKIFEFEFDIS